MKKNEKENTPFYASSKILASLNGDDLIKFILQKYVTLVDLP